MRSIRVSQVRNAAVLLPQARLSAIVVKMSTFPNRKSRPLPQHNKIESIVRHSEAVTAWRRVLTKAQYDHASGETQRATRDSTIVDRNPRGRQGEAFGPAYSIFPHLVSRSLVQDIVWMDLSFSGNLQFSSEPQVQFPNRYSSIQSAHGRAMRRISQERNDSNQPKGQWGR